MHEKKICVIIPAYNAGGMLEECLRSLENQTCTDFGVIVIDDASSDGSAARIGSLSLPLTLLSNASRLGPEQSRNIGIERSRSPYLAFLDADAVAHRDWLKELLRVMEADPRTGVCACRIRGIAQPRGIESAGHELYYDFSPMHRGEGAREEDYAADAEVFGACFAAAMVRREVFDAAGSFDEAYGYNFGDDEWSWRAQLAGYRCLYCAAALVDHRRVRTARMGKALLFAWEKNRVQSIIKYYPPHMAFFSAWYTLKRFAASLAAGGHRETGLSLPEVAAVIACAWGAALLHSGVFFRQRGEVRAYSGVSFSRMRGWLKRKWQTHKG